MANKIVYTFDNNQKVTFKEVSSDYVLQDREVFSISGYYKPIWDNGITEGMTQIEIDEILLTDLKRRREFEIPNLKLGAQRIASGHQGTKEQIENAIAFDLDMYNWASGVVKVSTTMENLYLLKLSQINAERQANGERALTVEEYKKDIVEDYNFKTELHREFTLYIKMAIDKLDSLIEAKEVARATTVMELIEDVKEDTTRAEAEAILTQILQS